MAKIIPFNTPNEARDLPLTPLMIQTLKAACKLQSDGRIFGPIDFGRSFLSLVERMFIDCKKVIHKNKSLFAWFVTDAGMNALAELNCHEPCQQNALSMKSSLPPSAKMIQALMDCHERELMQQIPCTTYNTRHTTGLYIRGFLAVKDFTDPMGRKQSGFLVTKLGKQYLTRYASK